MYVDLPLEITRWVTGNKALTRNNNKWTVSLWTRDNTEPRHRASIVRYRSSFMCGLWWLRRRYAFIGLSGETIIELTRYVLFKSKWKIINNYNFLHYYRYLKSPSQPKRPAFVHCLATHLSILPRCPHELPPKHVHRTYRQWVQTTIFIYIAVYKQLV